MVRALTALVGLGIVGKRINRLARQTGALTLVDLLRDRFSSRAIGLIYPVIIVLITTVYLLAQFAAGAKILENMLGIEYRTGLAIFLCDRGSLHDLWWFSRRGLDRYDAGDRDDRRYRVTGAVCNPGGSRGVWRRLRWASEIGRTRLPNCMICLSSEMTTCMVLALVRYRRISRRSLPAMRSLRTLRQPTVSRGWTCGYRLAWGSHIFMLRSLGRHDDAHDRSTDAFL